MGISEISAGEFFSQFFAEDSLPKSISHNGRAITVEDILLLQDAAHRQIVEEKIAYLLASRGAFQTLSSKRCSVLSSELLEPFHKYILSSPPSLQKHFWKNFAHFCKKHKKEILIAVAVAAVIAGVAAAVIYGTATLSQELFEIT